MQCNVMAKGTASGVSFPDDISSVTYSLYEHKCTADLSKTQFTHL